MKLNTNCEASSLTNENFNPLDNHEVNCSEPNKEKMKGKHCTEDQNKEIRSDFGKEFFPANPSKEIRGRSSKLPPFRAGRYIPSDGYLYSSWNFGITEEVCDEKGKDVKLKSRVDKALSERISAKGEVKETRIQSASFHGLETKRTRPRLRMRCRSTDCSRPSGQDRIMLNGKISSNGCVRALSEGKKSRVKCRSADLSSLTIQHETNYRGSKSTPSIENSSFGSCLSKQNSKEDKVSIKKFDTQLSRKENGKDSKKTDSLQKTAHETGMDAIDANANSPSTRKNSSNLIKSCKQKSNVKTSQINCDTTNKDTVSLSSRNGQTSRAKTEKGVSTPKPSSQKPYPQKNEKKKLNANRSLSPSKHENSSIAKDLEAVNICRKPASSETNVVEECSKICTNINQIHSTHIQPETKSDHDTETLDSTIEKDNCEANRDKKVEGTVDVQNKTQRTCTDDAVFRDTNMISSCSDNTGNNDMPAGQFKKGPTAISSESFGKSDIVIKTSDTKDCVKEKLSRNLKLQGNKKTKVTNRPSKENRTTSENSRSDLNKNASEKDQLPNMSRNPEAKKTSSGWKLSGGVNKYEYEKKSESTESSRKLAFQRRESYSKQLREKNMRNVELKKKMGIINKGVRLQEDSGITVKIKHVKSRRLLRRNVAYVKREQKLHFSKEHDHDTWILFTVTMSSSLVRHVTPAGLDVPDGRNSPQFCKSAKALLSCVLPQCGNVVPKVKSVLVRSSKSNLKRLFFLPVKKLRWCLFDGMVMYLVWLYIVPLNVCFALVKLSAEFSAANLSARDLFVYMEPAGII